jgi:hypothetical protein
MVEGESELLFTVYFEKKLTKAFNASQVLSSQPVKVFQNSL